MSGGLHSCDFRNTKKPNVRVDRPRRAKANQRSGQTRCWAAPRSSLGQVHLRQYRTPQETVGIREGFRDLEVVVALGDEELHGLARCLHPSSEIPLLPFKLCPLQCAVAV